MAGLVAGAGASQASMHPVLDWFNSSIWKRIDITGRRTLGIHKHTVVGDRDAFDSLNYYGEGEKVFTDTGQMTIVGNKVLGFFNFNMTLTDDRYTDPQSKRIWMAYEKSGFQFGYGDLTSVSLLNTNEFARYTKTLSGATFGYNKGRFAFKSVRTETKSSARTRSLQGTNSVGPYYIGDSQIVNDSEEIRVDGTTMKQGQDYTINYQMGAITFVSRVIAPTSTIVVSYETLGFNRSAGVVQGAGLAYDMGKFGKLGLTAIQQKSAGSTGLSTYTDKWQGQGPPTSPYTLAFDPMPTRPIIVKVNGILQTLGVDYVFGTDNAHNTIYSLIFFLRTIPSDDTVEFTFTPKPVQTIDGDRQVYGFDYRLPFGKRGFLSYSQATGKLDNNINPMSGTAKGIKGEYNWGSYHLHGAVRDVPGTFVSVESRTFNRNEKATEIGLDYKKKNYNWGVSANNSSITTQSLDSNNNVVFQNSRYATQQAFVNYTPEKGGLTWSLQHNRSQSAYLGSDSKVDTTSLTASKSFGLLNTRLSLEHQNGFGPITVGTTTKDGSVSLDAIRLNADYTTPSGWFFGTRTSLSRMNSLGTNGNGNDITLSTSYRPGKGPFDFEASWVNSNSGSLATLGSFQNGSGIGYGGNGFTGSSLGSTLLNGGNNYKSFTVTPNYRLNSKAQLNARFYQLRQSGSYSSDSETTSYGLGVNWDLGGNTLLAANVDQSATRFLELTTRTKSTTLDLALMGSPKGPWSYRIGVTSLVSGQTTDFAQDSLGIDGYLRHKLNSRSNLSFQFTLGRTSGYLPQSDHSFGLSYEYQLYRNVALVGSYKLRRVLNNDPTITNGAYRSSGFDLELSFNFGS